MDASAIYDTLKARFGDDILGFNGEGIDPSITVAPAALDRVASFLSDEPAFAFDALMCLSGVDHGSGKDLGVVYHLHSMTHRHTITLKVDVPRDAPHVPTVEHVWKTADWHEREAYDMVGIIFDGHSDLRRILCPDDWEGHPLRKDYHTQEYYTIGGKPVRVPV
ncbi:MAG: NADH-quinone oxidoreductase subunit C [Candidatus Latescibacteria bacterium]|nr:NADH-quinone oxidoreductase subunit C [Candidatus Latescibacterota bacterium]